MSETWRVIDESGAAHEVAVDEGRGSARSWWAATPGAARRSHASARDAAHLVDWWATQEGSHASARDAVVLVAQAQGWGIAEVLAPEQVGREEMAAEVAHLEARRGALIAEVDRLTAALREVARG